jgi:hypothetical protein
MIFLAYRVNYFTMLYQFVSYTVSRDVQDDDGGSIQELSGKSRSCYLRKTNTDILLDNLTKKYDEFQSVYQSLRWK